jgi:hypothetical protein
MVKSQVKGNFTVRPDRPALHKRFVGAGTDGRLRCSPAATADVELTFAG